MNSRERILAALARSPADRIPLDIGGMAQSGIHRTAYARLRNYLGLPKREIQTLNVITQAARLDEDLLERLEVDTRLVYGQWASEARVRISDHGDYCGFRDEWSLEWRMPRTGGFYYDMVHHPLAELDGDNVDELLKRFNWPDPEAPWRLQGLREEAKHARQQGKLVVLMGLCPGIVEVTAWLLGLQRFYMAMLSEPQVVEALLDKLVELKARYWRAALAAAGEFVDVVNEADDLAGQQALLISPEAYRQVIKPRHRALFGAIKQAAPHVKLLLHSCGAVRPLIPDFIELGVDALHPIQVSAAGMDPRELKREFGRDLCFWGGGVDTQRVLGRGTRQEVIDDVRRNIEALAGEGGFVFGTIHIIQADVPPENIMTMWETFRQYAGGGRGD